MPQGKLILVADDEPAICLAFTRFFEKRGYAVETTGDPEAVPELCSTLKPGILFLDLRLGTGDGMAILEKLGTSLPVVLMTAYGSLDAVDKAAALHAFDYLAKPIDLDAAKALADRATAQQDAAPEKPRATRGFIGSSTVMQKFYKQLLKTAASDAPVLLTGETGTGKELAARLIHDRSSRAAAPFIPVNCGALPENLVESQLFGYTKGAFTGAAKDSTGLCGAADKGTLFLDEIGDLPMNAQVKLLRFLDSGWVEPVGTYSPRKADVRVVAATNRNLEAAVEAGIFRADLYYRIAVLKVQTPPLREHREDIPELTLHFLAAAGCTFRPDDAAMQRMAEHNWQGNVRELRNFVLRAAAESGGITAEYVETALRGRRNDVCLENYINSLPLGEDCLKRALREVEELLVKRALDAAGGNRSKAAELLGLHRNSLGNLLKTMDNQE